MSIRISVRKNPYEASLKTGFPQGNSAPNSKTISKQNSEDKLAEASLRKKEYEQRAFDNRSVVEQSLSYANELRNARTKSKDTALEKKKLQYSFKKIASQIVRSKNSVSARKAVQAARREVMRLKRLKGNEEYDEEEIQLAIDHAKAMEKVAKKKVKHLEQEEMIERTHKGFGAALEEIEEKKEEEDAQDEEEQGEEEPLLPEDEFAVEDEIIQNSDWQMDMQMSLDQAMYEAQIQQQEMMEQSQEMVEQMQEMMEGVAENVQAAFEDQNQAMTELMEEFASEMADMMEELDLTELAQSTYAPDPNMNENDLKMLKIKHRTKEMKEIAEADKEYLKGIMEHEKSMVQGAGAATGSMPVASFGAELAPPDISGSFDVSV